ncbi:hypothetical protein HC891_05105 [Candidatus Gracilibacteria bacterium]|nr:hypothetical protein [Candidatus Gracilibacteria bacterium]
MVSRLVGWMVALTLFVGALPASAAHTVEFAAAPLGPAPAAAPAAVPTAPAAIGLALISRYEQPDYAAAFDESAAEIVVHDPVSERLFAVNGLNNTLDIIDISNPLTPTLALTITVGGSGPTSVAIYSNTVAVAVPDEIATNDGAVYFFAADTTDGTPLAQVSVGVLPDMVTFTPDGSKVLTANEGQPEGYEAGQTDPEGSISIIDISGNFAAPTPPSVTTADFTAFNAQADALIAAGVRIFGVDATVAQDLEPEYIAVSADSNTAYVTLQENNALAIVDIETATVTNVLPLGFKDHSVAPNALDASDRDDAINIQTWPAVVGMYQPDGIAAYEVGGTTFLVTANEGDAREYDGLEEEASVEDLLLDSSVFSGTTVFTDEENLGRLNVTTFPTSTEVVTFSQLYAFGARSFSIWNGEDGSLVFDSGDDIERRTAEIYPNNFNASNANNNFDNRSDNKGPEPESVVLGAIAGRTYAFIGLERIGGVMVYDVTEPTAPTYVTYVNNRNFNVDVEDPAAGDLGPEGLFFVTSENSPTGNPLLLVANEVSGSISIFQITENNPDGAGSLSLLHNNDGESTLLPIEVTVPPGAEYGNTVTQTIEIAGVAGFKAVTDREINEARAQNKAVVNLYAGDAFLASATLLCTLDDPNGPVYDALAQTQIPYTAHILGNHEFDYSPDFLFRFIEAFGGTQPFLSANLDFTEEVSFTDLLASNYLTTTSDFNENRVLFAPISGDGVIGGSLVYTDTATGQRFGIVGLTTDSLPTISTPRNVAVTSNLTETVAVAQEAIDLLYNELGVRKIIFASHLQDVDNDIELVSLLKHVDIAVAGGGDDLLVNTEITATLPITRQLLPGDEPAVDDDDNIRNYPLEVTDPDGRTVYIVTSMVTTSTWAASTGTSTPKARSPTGSPRRATRAVWC